MTAINIRVSEGNEKLCDMTNELSADTPKAKKQTLMNR